MEQEITNTGIEMETKLCITSDGSSYLKTTAKWATFLSILGFIGSGIMVFAALLMLIISPLSKLSSTLGFPMAFLGVIYLLLAIFYFFPAYYLYNFANKTKLALDTDNQEVLDDSLKNLKKMFKFIGIMTIVLITTYLIMIPTILILGFSKGLVH
jgi:hypothetical protein